MNTYLVTAVKYRAITLMASKSRRRRLEAGQGSSDMSENDTENKIDFNELQRMVAELIDNLPEKCRIVFELQQLGLSRKQIAAELQISERTVENHLAVARAKIRKGLMGSGPLMPVLLQILC